MKSFEKTRETIFQNWNIHTHLLLQKKLTKVLQNKVILPILVGILVIGITQFSFAEVYQETSYIAVDEEKFEQPQSRYNYQQITILGHIADYSRGANVTILIIDPNGSEEEINTLLVDNPARFLSFK